MSEIRVVINTPTIIARFPFSISANGGDFTSPLTTKGDILGFDTDNARIPVGTDGQALVADSAEALGVKFDDITTTPGGADTQIQVNISGSFEGFSELIWSDALKELQIVGDVIAKRVIVEGGTLSSPGLVIGSGDSGVSEFVEDQLSIIAGGIEAIRISEGNGRTSTIIGGTVVETITNATTSAASATLIKAGENFLTTVNEGDAIVVYDGSTAVDFGTYLVVSVDSNTQLTLDRIFTDSNTDVDFDVITKGAVIENSVEDGVARLTLPTRISETKPTLSFPQRGGISEIPNGALAFGVGGSDKCFLTSTRWIGDVANSWTLQIEGASATNPVFAFANDADTGLGSNGADQLSIIAGEKEISRAVEDTTEQFIINPQADLTGTSSAPSLAFGDGDSGDYEVSDDVIARGVGGIEAQRWALNSTGVLISQQLTSGITASVTQTQGNGALTSSKNEVSVVANTNDTVTLPTAFKGLEVIIINNGANTLQVFPASGDNLGAGVDTSTTQASGLNVTYLAIDSTNWEQI